jgi:large subunit ribosomal protein L6
MSRIGKQPVIIPEGVSVSVDAKSRMVLVKGSKGELSFKHHRFVEVIVGDNSVQVSPKSTSNEAAALWGTTARIVKNMIEGVSNGFEKKLELNGVGFRMNVQGKTLAMALGFSHPVNVEIPEGITAVIADNVLTISGMDKQRVGQFAAEIRSLKPVEPYKGKGFRYVGEIVRRKEGKKAGA